MSALVKKLLHKYIDLIIKVFEKGSEAPCTVGGKTSCPGSININAIQGHAER